MAVVFDINVLHSFMKRIIFRQVYCTLTITIERIGNKTHPEFTKKYSASVVDKDTVPYNFDIQFTAPPPSVKT